MVELVFLVREWPRENLLLARSKTVDRVVSIYCHMEAS